MNAAAGGMAGAYAELPLSAAVALGRIELESGRLRAASAVLDTVAREAPAFAEATNASIATSLASTHTELERLIAATRKYGVTQTRVERLSGLVAATNRIVGQAFSQANGVFARQRGLDGGACEEADRLIAELAALVDKRLARPTVPGDSEFLHRAADVIRRRLPDHGLWDLPVMAHEFGHVVVAHLQLYDPVQNQVLRLGEGVLTDWPGYSGMQAEELFCDILATYAAGPSYACTLLLHRLDPTSTDAGVTHPSDATRAAVVLEALTRLTKDEPRISRFRTVCGQVARAWKESQELALLEPRRPPPLPADVKRQVQTALSFLDSKVAPLRYRWPGPQVRDLAETFEANRDPVDLSTCRIRDVLSAAWMLRLSAWVAGTEPSPYVDARARAVLARIAGEEVGDG